MKKVNFTNRVEQQQIGWKLKYVNDQRSQTWNNGKVYAHLLPKDIWDQGLWEGVRQEVLDYIRDERIQPHPMKHSLKSSWTLCINLYFIIKKSAHFQELMLQFLKSRLGNGILSVDDVNFEFALPYGDELNQSLLLGEKEGGRGVGQTSPDVALSIMTDSGPGLILIECKYTEKSFYRCSARSTSERGDKLVNPDPQRCMQKADLTCYRDICHQKEWGRQYLNILELSAYGIKTLNNCPAATSGYQLLRQQALAEGIARSGRYAHVYNSVAYDQNNTDLINCLNKTGLKDWTKNWGRIFSGNAEYFSFTHQEWVSFVRDNHVNGLSKKWLTYIHGRYQY